MAIRVTHDRRPRRRGCTGPERAEGEAVTGRPRRKLFSEAEVAAALSCYDGGMKVPEICRRFGISERTFYLWRRQRAAGPGRSGPGPEGAAGR
jgi:transposase-like protein